MQRYRCCFITIYGDLKFNVQTVPRRNVIQGEPLVLLIQSERLIWSLDELLEYSITCSLDPVNVLTKTHTEHKPFGCKGGVVVDAQTKAIDLGSPAFLLLL